MNNTKECWMYIDSTLGFYLVGKIKLIQNEIGGNLIVSSKTMWMKYIWCEMYTKYFSMFNKMY